MKYIKPERFWNKVDKTDDHWLWRGQKTTSGYGKYELNMAHRISWYLTHGEIPKGMYVDHICRVRSCVNPAHLRTVIPRLNSLENSDSPSALNAKKTHCQRGHEFTNENTYIYVRRNGKRSRSCRTCILGKVAQRNRQIIAAFPSADEKVRCGKFARFSEMTWPIHIEDENDSVQWRLRYGEPSREDILFAASVMQAYAELVESPSRKRDAVIAILRRCVL